MIIITDYEASEQMIPSDTVSCVSAGVRVRPRASQTAAMEITRHLSSSIML